MRYCFTWILIFVLWGSIGIPIVHARCVNKGSVNNIVLCNEVHDCNKHLPENIFNDEISSYCFNPRDEIQQSSSKIFFDLNFGSLDYCFLRRDTFFAVGSMYYDRLDLCRLRLYMKSTKKIE